MSVKSPTAIAAASAVKSLIKTQSKKTKGKKRSAVSGGLLESVIENLESFGFKKYSYAKFLVVKSEGSLPNRYIICGVPYKNLLARFSKKSRLGTPKTEFVICATDANPTNEFPLFNGEPLIIRIECKWQQSAGTTKDKLPMTVLNMRHSIPENKVIIVMDGDGFNDETHQFISELCEGELTWKSAPATTAKTLRKMRLDEFFDWRDRAFGQGDQC